MGRLIGITGVAGSGKDAAAAALVAAGWRRAAFADRMREAVLALDPWVIFEGVDGNEGWARLSDLVEAHGWDDAKRMHGEIRRLLQRFGTEAGRDIHGEDCWIDLVLAPWVHASNTPGPKHDLVVTDCRFENEAVAIRRAGGLVVRIERPDIEELPGNHVSEAGLPERLVSAVIHNDASVEDLHAAILDFAARRA